MEQVLFKGKAVNVSGALPKKGFSFPEEVTLTNKQLKDISLNDLKGKKMVVNIFPSIDTPTCQTAVRSFFKKLANRPELILVNISNDLPFAMDRFCATEGMDSILNLSSFRSSFGEDVGALIIDGPLKGLLARSVLILDEEGKVIYTQRVEEISGEPNYEEVLSALEN